MTAHPKPEPLTDVFCYLESCEESDHEDARISIGRLRDVMRVVEQLQSQVSAARPRWTDDELRKEAAVLAVRANERRAIRAEALEESARHFEGDGTHYGGDDIAEMIRSLSNTQG